jgi:CRP-like cAMP-binding protein
VFHQNDPPTHVHWVRNGLLRLYQTLANGRRQIVGFAFPGEFVDLAAFLIEMHNRTCVGDPAQRDLCLPMPRSDIADYLGLTPETVSRLFTRFVQLGLIALCKRRGVSLLGFAALQRLAQGLPG